MAKFVEWKNRILYQIFPRSFYDSNNDGNGDLKGITNKLDYIKELGVDAIWMCPIYDTEFADAGYDVKNYKKVWSQFGTLNDFQKLAIEARKRGIDIIMDIVLNHVSNKHKWFLKAKESVNNIEHDYFIWRNKLNSHEKNALSIFGGSAWEYVPLVKKYYFHLFAKAQVDLNWEHPNTIQAMVDVINFWYNLGVRGFRFDAIKHISKEFPQGMKTNYSWGKGVVSQLQKFHKLAFKGKKDTFILGESSGITLQEALKYGIGQNKVSTNYYNFSWWWIGWGITGRNGYDPNWDFKNFVNQMKGFQENKKVTPELMTNFLSNHDTSRSISRWGNELEFWEESAKTHAILLFVLKGIPCVYYGEEIGMLNPKFKNKNEFRDIDAFNAYKTMVDSNKPIYTEEEMTKYLSINGRDNSRTPMQWNKNKNAGFSNANKTWIKVGESFETVNVESQLNNPHSILNFYKAIIKTRKSSMYGKILVEGTSKLELIQDDVIKSTRKYNGKTIIAFINMTNLFKEYTPINGAKILHRSWSDNKKINGQLRPYESIIFFK